MYGEFLKVSVSSPALAQASRSRGVSSTGDGARPVPALISRENHSCLAAKWPFESATKYVIPRSIPITLPPAASFIATRAARSDSAGFTMHGSSSYWRHANYFPALVILTTTPLTVRPGGSSRWKAVLTKPTLENRIVPRSWLILNPDWL